MDLVQIQHPIAKHYNVIDRDTGRIVKQSKKNRPFKDIPIIPFGSPPPMIDCNPDTPE